ncbi:MAG: oligosaccharide flippase family protein [Nitrospiria bacterium]
MTVQPTELIEGPASAESGREFAGRAVRSTVTNIVLSIVLKACVLLQSIIVARMFSPAELGLFATALMAAWFAMLFAESGASQAIIRSPTEDRHLVNTGFTINVVIGAVLFAIVLLAAPLIASRTDHPDAAAYIRVLAILTFTQALVIPSAVLIKRLRFVTTKIPHFIEVIVFLAVTTLLFKVFAAGVWSLVWGRVASFVALYSSLWALAPYRPRLRFDAAEARSLLSFGWPLLVVGVCSYLVWQGDQWLILYFWGPEQLAYYVLAFSLPFYMKEFADMAAGTLFPIFSKVRGAGYSLQRAFDESNRYLAVLGVFLGTTLCVFAPAIIHFVYTDKWAPAVPLLRLFAIAMTCSMVIGYNWGALAVVAGRTRYVMIVNLWILALLGTLGVFLISRFGPMGGVMFMAAHVAVMIGVFRLPFIYRELNSLSFLAPVARVAAAGVIAGGLTHLFIVPSIASFGGLILGAAGFSVLYLAALAICDRRIVRDAAALAKLAFEGRRPAALRVKRALGVTAMVAGLSAAAVPQAAAVDFETIIHRVQTGGGTSTDVAIDHLGLPHIAHVGDRETDGATVRYSRWGTTGTNTDTNPWWVLQCLDRSAAFPSIALDVTHQRHLAYTNPDWSGDPHDGALNYGSFVDLWKLQKLDDTLGWMFGETSIAADADGRPHIAYVHAQDTAKASVGDLRYAAYNGTSWSPTEVVKAGSATSGTGAWNALALSASGVPSIAYRDAGLWLATRDGAGQWSSVARDGSGAGYEVSMVIEGPTHHMAYFDANLKELRYFREGTLETIADVPWATAERLERHETSIKIAIRDGVPFVAYSDFSEESAEPSTARVRVAHRTDGVWTLFDVDGGGAGLYASMGITPEGHVVVSYFDTVNKELKVAFLIDRGRDPIGNPFGKILPVPTGPANGPCTSKPAETLPASTTDAAVGFFGCGLVRPTGGGGPSGGSFGDMLLLLAIPLALALKKRFPAWRHLSARGLEAVQEWSDARRSGWETAIGIVLHAEGTGSYVSTQSLLTTPQMAAHGQPELYR